MYLWKGHWFCVSLSQTNTPNITSNVTMLLKWMLTSLPLNASLSVENITRDFNSSNINDWAQYVVTPVVQQYSNQTSNINSEIGRIVLWVEHILLHVSIPYSHPTNSDLHVLFSASDPQPADPVEICRVTSNNSSCHVSCQLLIPHITNRTDQVQQYTWHAIHLKNVKISQCGFVLINKNWNNWYELMM